MESICRSNAVECDPQTRNNVLRDLQIEESIIGRKVLWPQKYRDGADKQPDSANNCDQLSLGIYYHTLSSELSDGAEEQGKSYCKMKLCLYLYVVVLSVSKIRPFPPDGLIAVITTYRSHSGAR